MHISYISHICMHTNILVCADGGRQVCSEECVLIRMHYVVTKCGSKSVNPKPPWWAVRQPKEPTHQLLDQPQVPPTREVQGTVQGSLVTPLRMSLFCKIIVCVFSKKCFVGDGLSRPPLIDKFSINFLPKGPACPVCS